MIMSLLKKLRKHTEDGVPSRVDAEADSEGLRHAHLEAEYNLEEFGPQTVGCEDI